MRALGIAAAVVLTLASGGIATGVSFADDGSTPSKADVHQARVAVRDQARDVASVRARVVLANQQLQQSGIVAAQAAEAYNGARWRAQQARKAAAAAQRHAAVAENDVQRSREAYTDAIVTSYELSPGLTSLSAIAQSNGIGTVVQRTVTMQNAESALDGNYDEFRASATVATVVSHQAAEAQATAVKAQQDALAAKQAAQSAADAAAAQAQSIAGEKARLITQLAHLQHISVQLAQRRQVGLERAAAAAAAAAAEKQREHEAAVAAAKAAAQKAAQQAAQQSAQQAAQHAAASSDPTPSNPTSPSDPTPTSTPTPPPPSTPPPPASGVSAAIAFARDQIGEPYVWGAAGPSSWDCSGLVMGAWRAGGKYLPHYSVAQYEQSTPISAGQLEPGDLVFWGTTDSPGSIYHVALYVGGGMIIQAPRTGVPVQEVSMYDWITPNFYARP